MTALTLCLYVNILDRGWGAAKLCALREHHGGMHVLQTAAQVRRWWPDG